MSDTWWHHRSRTSCRQLQRRPLKLAARCTCSVVPPRIRHRRMLALVVTALLWSSRRIRCTTPQQTHGPTAALIGGRIGHAFITSATKTDVVEEYDPAT